jgi:hypothetical protein
MEQLLDVKKQSDKRHEEAMDPESDPRYQVQQADAASEEGERTKNWARQRYQRFFFETVMENTASFFFSLLVPNITFHAGAHHA